MNLGGHRLPPWWPFVAHVVVAAGVCWGAVFEGKVPYFRDVGNYYYPNYVFLGRALGQGVWPLWNPTCDAGGPFLITYPGDLLLVGLLGAEAALRFEAPLHLALAMVGASVLARMLGLGPLGAWAAGVFFGLSGYLHSSANLFELFHATAWGPLVVAAMLLAWRAPGPRAAALLGLVAAVQASTLGAETVVQTGLVGLVLLRERPERRRVVSLGGGLVLAFALAAPALLGARDLVQGTARAAGFDPAMVLAWSVRPIVFLDALLPGFFGNPHSFTNAGYWGQAFFPGGYPYLLSLYLGAGVLLLAAQAGAFPWRGRLWALAGLGILLALGWHGPLGTVLATVMRSFRNPTKFLYMSNLALCLLAAQAVHRAAGEGARRPSVLWCFPGLLAAALHPVLSRFPELPARLLGGLVPELREVTARDVVASSWPHALGVAGLLWACAMLVRRWHRLAPLAPLLIALDLLIVNGTVNPVAPPEFYTLRPEVREMVERARGEGDHRWFAYGVVRSPGLVWAPEILRRNSDVWAYYMERQSLLPRMHVLDGLEGAFDEDRVGWAPRGSTLSPHEGTPAFFLGHYARLRGASVRWVLSFYRLPPGLTRLRGTVGFPEIREPLGLYEILDPLPRAFWVRDLSAADRPTGEGQVLHERLDPHTVRVQVAAPAGYVVVTEGFRDGWRVTDESGRPRPLTVANGRYWAIPVGGGNETLTVRYRPAWRAPALVAAGLGLAAALALLVRRPPSRPS